MANREAAAYSKQKLRGASKEKALTLLHVLHHFLKTHPEATPHEHPWSKQFIAHYQ